MIALDIQQPEILRLGIFMLLLVVLLLLQYWFPRRSLSRSRWRGRVNNLVLVGMGNGLIALSIGLAALAQGGEGFGLLQVLGLDGLPLILIGIVLLDCAIYWQHRLFHTVPLLWRIHRVHHSDAEFEVTTAVRFHPFELLLSYLIKVALVLLLGVNAITVVAFEIVLFSTALFSHSNLHLPPGVSKAVRLLIVTPDMHRIHHSQIHKEHNSNYGFSFSIWDRIFASYTREPQQGHEKMEIGLSWLADGNLMQLLAMPFLTVDKKWTKRAKIRL